MSQDIYNSIPNPGQIKLFDRSKIDQTAREIAAIMIDAEQVEKHNIARDGSIVLQFDITRYRLNTAEKSQLCKIFHDRGWTTVIRNGEMTDQGSTYMTLSET